MNTDRRTILTGAAAALAAVPAMAMAQRQPRMGMDPAAMPMPDVSGTRTHTQFEMGVFGPAMLSLATSQIAVDRARKTDAREFAGFELAEAVAVTTVLKQLGNPSNCSCQITTFSPPEANDRLWSAPAAPSTTQNRSLDEPRSIPSFGHSFTSVSIICSLVDRSPPTLIGRGFRPPAFTSRSEPDHQIRGA